MPDGEAVAGGLAVAKEAVELFEVAERAGFFDKVLSALKKKRKVLVLGSSGVGKTNFLESLKQTLPEAIHTLNRTSFVEDRKILIKKEPFVFVDTPGQIDSEARRKQAIRDALHGIDGIINVVAYGYHEGKSGTSSVFDDQKKIKPDFLAQNRANEIELLNEWKTLLGDKDTAGWLITLVSKADLWWDQRDDVIPYYKSGPYYAALADARQLQPVVLPYCSVFHKFYDEAPLSGYFDDADRIRVRAEFVANLLTAVSNREK